MWLEDVDLETGRGAEIAGVVEQPLERIQALGAESDDRDSHGVDQAAAPAKWAVFSCTSDASSAGPHPSARSTHSSSYTVSR